MEFNNFEPTRNNRFIVEIPGIPPYVVKSMSSLAKHILYDSGWDPVEFELYSVSGVLKNEHEVVSADFNVEHRLINYVNNHKNIELNIGVKILDATGKEIVTMVLSECDFISLDLGSKNSNSDDITTIRFTVKPKSVSSHTNL